MAGFDLVPGGTGHNYTGMLTRSIVFSGALIIFLIGTGLTLASIIIPEWISYDQETNHGTRIHITYGLHRRCSNTIDPFSTTGLHCEPFPKESDCKLEGRYFCSMWRSVGFLMSFAVVIEGMTIAAFLILIIGGKQRREQGWGVMALLALIAALVQACAMALIVSKAYGSTFTLANKIRRHISTITMTASSSAGSWTAVGPCAPLVGCFRRCVQLLLRQQLWLYQVRVAMS